MVFYFFLCLSELCVTYCPSIYQYFVSLVLFCISELCYVFTVPSNRYFMFTGVVLFIRVVTLYCFVSTNIYFDFCTIPSISNIFVSLVQFCQSELRYFVLSFLTGILCSLVLFCLSGFRFLYYSLNILIYLFLWCCLVYQNYDMLYCPF